MQQVVYHCGWPTIYRDFYIPGSVGCFFFLWKYGKLFYSKLEHLPPFATFVVKSSSSTVVQSFRKMPTVDFFQGTWEAPMGWGGSCGCWGKHLEAQVAWSSLLEFIFEVRSLNNLLHIDRLRLHIEFLSFVHHSWAEVSSIVCLESMMEFWGLFVALQKHALFKKHI